MTGDFFGRFCLWLAPLALVLLASYVAGWKGVLALIALLFLFAYLDANRPT